MFSCFQSWVIFWQDSINVICLGLPIFLSRITTEVIPNIHLHTFSLYTYRVLLLTRIFKCLQVHLTYLYLSAYQIYNSLSWYLVMWCDTAFHVYKTPQRCSQDFSRGRGSYCVSMRVTCQIVMSFSPHVVGCLQMGTHRHPRTPLAMSLPSLNFVWW